MGKIIKVPLDESTAACLAAEKANTKSPLATIASSWVITADREIGLETLLRADSPFPLIYAPPQAAPRLQMMFNDEAVYATVYSIVRKTNQSLSAVMHSIMREIAAQKMGSSAHQKQIG